MKYILALDQGTTSSRAVLFDSAGVVRDLAQKDFTQYFPKPGWVEHDPEEIWASQSAVLEEVLCQSGATPGDITAIGIANQRETTVLWDRETGRSIGRAIVWQDRRTAKDCERLRASGLETLVKAKTGLLLDPYFSGTKVRWILDNIEGARSGAEEGRIVFGTVDSWLVWKLTGGKRHITDPTNASRTLLYDIHCGRWDPELLAAFEIPAAVLPEVVASSGVCATVSNGSSLDGVPIAGIAGDQQAALFGQACHQPGMAKNTYGTGCFLLLNTGEHPIKSQNNLLTTIAWKIGDTVEYALEGSVFIGGAVVQWLRDGLEIIKESHDVETLAGEVEGNGGVFFVPAFSGLGAPHWDPAARGLMVGMTRGTKAAHIARASLEAIAYQSYEVLEAMQRDAGITLREARVDGGASRNDLLMQFQSDLLGVPVVRPPVTETTALGVAYLAGLAVGVWRDRGEISRQWRVDREFQPAMDQASRNILINNWRRAVELTKGWHVE